VAQCPYLTHFIFFMLAITMTQQPKWSGIMRQPPHPVMSSFLLSLMPQP
jgi:hypothetical protein